MHHGHHGAAGNYFSNVDAALISTAANTMMVGKGRAKL
jgi:hypothetical protein